MIIERNISRFIVFTDDTLHLALQKISENRSGVVFAIDRHGVLEGILTDGDFRRWLLRADRMDLTLSTAVAMNREFVSFRDTDALLDIRSAFSERVETIPLLDRLGRLVGLAFDRPESLQIGRFTLSQENPCFLVAEIGNNHNGNIEAAFRLVENAVAAGADCAKFQMRDLPSLYRDSQIVGAGEDLGSEYTLDLLRRFQLTNEEMFKVFDYCKDKGILPLCTPWDVKSVHSLEAYGVAAYKLASADLTNPEMLEALCKTRKPLLCSTGMSSEAEIKDAVALLRKKSARYVLLHCNSTYPAPFKDINLNYMDRLKDLGGGCLVGYSGHERGYAVAVAAVARGAKVIEKHFTLDREMEGNDHRVSLLPTEFAEMARSIREVELSLGSSKARRLTQGEMINREVLGKSLQAAKDIKRGDRIALSDVCIRSPGKGLAPYRLDELVGRQSKRDMAAGELFYPSDISSENVAPRNYCFDRHFGIPVRYHDFSQLVSKSNFDLVEFHLSYKDLALDPAAYLRPEGYRLHLLVHSPELFEGDHVMDLCSAREDYRTRSIDELVRILQTTRELARYFPSSDPPRLIINAGGFSSQDFVSAEKRRALYARLHDALDQIDAEGVEILPQTMPPFPWHFGGQQFHNLFTDADEIVEFCSVRGMRICLDVSHAKLACNQSKKSFNGFIEKVGPLAAHLHIVDAAGVDGEGLQIGEGEIDFTDLGKLLREYCPKASFIPEVWQGHKNGGEGFWVALDQLERMFHL